MTKTPHVRKLMDSQHFKKSERLLKCALHYFCHFFFDNSETKSAREVLSVVSKILRIFVNILTPHDKHSLSVKASV